MTTSHRQSTSAHFKQQQLFDVKTRIQEMIDRIDTEKEKGNIVRVRIPKISHLCKDIVPQFFNDDTKFKKI